MGAARRPLLICVGFGVFACVLRPRFVGGRAEAGTQAFEGALLQKLAADAESEKSPRSGNKDGWLQRGSGRR